MASGSIVPRLLPAVHCMLGLAAALEVQGQLGSDLPGSGAIARLQALGNAPVQLLSSRSPQLLVQHLLVERMLKSIAPATGSIRPYCQPGVVDEVVLRRQGFTPGLDLFQWALNARRDNGRGKHLARHTGNFQRLSQSRREVLDAP